MEEKILNVLVSMQSDFYDMKNDINDIKKDVSGMKVEINEMKQDIKQLNVRMDRLETKVDEIDKKHESNYIELRRQRQIDSNNLAQKGTGFIFVVAKINPVPNFKILVLYLFF